MNMNKTFKNLFGSIQAEEELKDRTKAFLEKRTLGYSKVKAETHKYHLYAAVCACFLFMLFGGYWLYFTPIAEISIDINPSIEMSINRFDRVISVSDFNQDGQELSSTLHIKYKNYMDAVKLILNHKTIALLLADNEIMTITVIGPDRQQSAKILSEVEVCAREHSNTYCYAASSEEVAAAHEMGLSCGKYRAFLELQALAPNVTPETVGGMTMREIRELINSLSGDSENDTFLNHNQGNWHHGHGAGRGSGWRNRRMEQQNQQSE